MTFGGWLRHHAWREHRKSPLLTKNNGVSWGRKAAESSDSTWPSEVGVWSFTTRKSSNEYGVFIDVTSGVDEWRIQEHTHHYIHRHTHPDHAMPRSMTSALNPKRSWRVSGPRLPRTGVMTSSPVVDHRTSSPAEIFSQGPSEYEKGWLSLPVRSKQKLEDLKLRILQQKS